MQEGTEETPPLPTSRLLPPIPNQNFAQRKDGKSWRLGRRRGGKGEGGREGNGNLSLEGELGKKELGGERDRGGLVISGVRNEEPGWIIDGFELGVSGKHLFLFLFFSLLFLTNFSFFFDAFFPHVYKFNIFKFLFVIIK